MKKLLFASVLAAVAFCSVGCAVAQSPPASSPAPAAAAQSLDSVTSVDLEAAIAIAKASNDQVAAGCYSALKSHLGEPAAMPAVAGVFSAFEAARMKVNTFAAGVPPDVHIACAPVVLDAQTVLLRLGIIGAGRLLPIP